MIASLAFFFLSESRYFVCILAEAWRDVHCTTNDFTIDMYYDAIPRFINITTATVYS